MNDEITEMLTKVKQDPNNFKGADGKFNFTKTPTKDQKDYNGGINLLHYAVMDNDFELVKNMVENGADIFDRTTVFHLLAKRDGKCDEDIKNYLIEKSGKTCEEIVNMGNVMQNPVFRWNIKCN